MPATKMQRRRAQQSSKLSGKSTSTQQQHDSINIGSFARVSKAMSITAIPAKDIDAKKPTATHITTTTTTSRKRKAAAPASDDEDSSSEQRTRTPKKISTAAAAPAPTPTPARASRSRTTPASKKSRPEPAPRKRARSPSVSDSEEPTINAGALFKRLRLECSPAPATPPLTPDASGISDSENTPDILPDEVLGLIDLHASLLKTLTLHYAHNGANTPADLRRLCPDVARSWRRKKVTGAEIQTCIGVLGASAENQPFSLVNYGHNKICIELDQAYTSSTFNEKELNSLFYENLFSLWRKCWATQSSNGQDFLRSLPKADIKVCESFVKAAPIFAKGQQRLEDLKQGIAAKKLEKEAAQSKTGTAGAAAAATADTPMTNSDGTKMSLLDRIRQKALQKAQAPAGLTPAQLERRAALQRAVEVSALVGMLSRATGNGSSGGGRMSFTMTAMLEKLKDTFRMGISRDEGAACVRLLGKEIAPEWIRVVVVAGRENVVIDTNRSLSKGDIERRVQQLL